MAQPDATNEADRHRNLCARMRQLREAAGRTQSDFAAELTGQPILQAQGRTITRHKVNRIENGHAPVDAVLAEALDEYARDRDQPAFGFVALASEVSAAGSDNARGRELRQLLGTRDLDKVQIIMCDLTDFAFYLSLTPLVPTLNVTVLVPTAERVQALFGTRRDESDHGSGAYDDYGERLTEHLWRQVRLLYRIAAGRDGLALDVIQSQAVFNSMVLARHGRHASCVYWPPVPAERSQPEPDLVPSVGDPSVAAWYEKQIAQRTAEASDMRSSASRPIHLGDMYLMTEPLRPAERVRQTESSRFLQFLPRGVARREIDAERTVVAIALLLPYVRSVSEGAPSIELLFRSRAADSQDADRAPRRRLSFLSAWVAASAGWQALNEADADDSELATLPSAASTPSLQAAIAGMAHSQRHLVEQSREFIARLSEYQRSSGAYEDRSTVSVLDGARRIALCDELELVHGLDRSIAASRLQGTSIADWRVRKDAGADISARIYCLELNPGERDGVSDRAGRYRPGSLARLTMREVRAMMADFSSAGSEHEFSDCLGLALSHDLVRSGFAELLDALEASDSSTIVNETAGR